MKPSKKLKRNGISHEELNLAEWGEDVFTQRLFSILDDFEKRLKKLEEN